MDLIAAEKLKKHFKLKKRVVKALDGVDIAAKEGRTTALVGESGCGKTTLAKTILGLYHVTAGKIYYDSLDITNAPRKHRNAICKNIQIVFQNPFLSFDPRFRIFSTLFEALSVFSPLSKKDAPHLIAESLHKVGLNEDYLYRYPHQLSGGQLQRVALARALINSPRVVILDEPTSSLDVSTTVKIIELLEELQQKNSLTYLFISHNLGLVKKISHYVYVMFNGCIVESGSQLQIYESAMHPYTQLLLKACRYEVKDAARYMREIQQGCVYKSLCRKAKEKCSQAPLPLEVAPRHYVFCHFPDR